MCSVFVCIVFGGGFFIYFIGQGDVLESHPFGERGQEILISYKEPGELLFFFNLAASCSVSPY